MITTRKKLQEIIDGRVFRLIVVGLIILNAIVIGLETSKLAVDDIGSKLTIAKYTILFIFVIEIILKILVKRNIFFKEGWNIFDFLVVSISLVPHASGLSILRSFRLLHSLEMFRVSPHMRHIIQALNHVGITIINVCFLMAVTFYVLGVVGVELFSKDFPEYFGTLSLSFFTNFRLMVFDDFGIIAQTISTTYHYAWIYFMVITLLLSFTFINLFVAVVVTGLQRSIESDKDPLEETLKKEEKEIRINQKTIQDLSLEIKELKAMIKELKKT